MTPTTQTTPTTPNNPTTPPAPDAQPIARRLIDTSFADGTPLTHLRTTFDDTESEWREWMDGELAKPGTAAVALRLHGQPGVVVMPEAMHVLTLETLIGILRTEAGTTVGGDPDDPEANAAAWLIRLPEP